MIAPPEEFALILVGAVLGVALVKLFDWSALFDSNVSDTVVFLRQTKRANCRHWEARVRYDDWGSPYVKCPEGIIEIALRPDGLTSDTIAWGTQWKHKSGPPVTFVRVPARAFEEEPHR